MSLVVPKLSLAFLRCLLSFQSCLLSSLDEKNETKKQKGRQRTIRAIVSLDKTILTHISAFVNIIFLKIKIFQPHPPPHAEQLPEHDADSEPVMKYVRMAFI